MGSKKRGWNARRCEVGIYSAVLSSSHISGVNVASCYSGLAPQAGQKNSTSSGGVHGVEALLIWHVIGAIKNEPPQFMQVWFEQEVMGVRLHETLAALRDAAPSGNLWLRILIYTS